MAVIGGIRIIADIHALINPVQTFVVLADALGFITRGSLLGM